MEIISGKWERGPVFFRHTECQEMTTWLQRGIGNHPKSEERGILKCKREWEQPGPV